MINFVVIDKHWRHGYLERCNEYYSNSVVCNEMGHLKWIHALSLTMQPDMDLNQRTVKKDPGAWKGKKVFEEPKVTGLA